MRKTLLIIVSVLLCASAAVAHLEEGVPGASIEYRFDAGTFVPTGYVGEQPDDERERAIGLLEVTRVGDVYSKTPLSFQRNAAHGVLMDATTPSKWLTVAGNTGLTGEYYEGAAFNTLKLTRTDGQINFASLRPAEIPAGAFSVRWTGKLIPVVSDTYTFSRFYGDEVSDSTVTIRISGNVVNAPIALVAGQTYTVQVEFVLTDAGSNGSVALKWEGPKHAKMTVERGCLALPTAYAQDYITIEQIRGFAHVGGKTEGPENMGAIQIWGWRDTDGDGKATINDSRVGARTTKWVKLSEATGLVGVGGDVGVEISEDRPIVTGAWGDVLQISKGGTAITIRKGESWLLLIRALDIYGNSSLLDVLGGTEQWDDGDTANGIGADVPAFKYIDASGNTPGTSDGRLRDGMVVWVYLPK